MFSSDLTTSERALIDSLPKLPAVVEVRSTNIWIVEWLSPGERRTGTELYDWMEQQRPKWAIYNQCDCKADVIRSIEQAAQETHQTGIMPILHIEAHGGPDGIAPSTNIYEEVLTWAELTVPLQKLNVATKCNLMVVVAACLGFAAIKALTQGPRAPAVALVGPDATVNESDLLLGAKEFYRRLKDESPQLTYIAESASREMNAAGFEIEPFATLAYESFIEQVVRKKRPSECQDGLERLRQRMHQETSFSSKEIEKRLADLPKDLVLEKIEQLWNYMFMFDLEPRNEERFGLNWDEIKSRMLAVSVE